MESSSQPERYIEIGAQSSDPFQYENGRYRLKCKAFEQVLFIKGGKVQVLQQHQALQAQTWKGESLAKLCEWVYHNFGPYTIRREAC